MKDLEDAIREDERNEADMLMSRPLGAVCDKCGLNHGFHTHEQWEARFDSTHRNVTG